MTKRFFVSGMIGVVALLSVPVAPAVASESELSAGQGSPLFQALSGLPDERRIELAAMTDEQLAAVEGAAFFCGICFKAVAIWHLHASAIKAVAIRHLKASVPVQRQHLHQNTVRIWQVNGTANANANAKANNTHQSNTAVVFQRN
jgi:hypothetical protein